MIKLTHSLSRQHLPNWNRKLNGSAHHIVGAVVNAQNQYYFFSTNSSSSPSPPSHESSSSATKNNDKSSSSPPISSHHVKFMNPIVSQLWEQRQLSKQRMMSLTDSESETTGSGNLQELTAMSIHKGKEEIKGNKIPTFKHPSASRTTIDYPFSQDEFLREAYCSPGGTMRFGKILEDLDALAGNIAFHHVVDNPMLVTAAVDRISLREIPRLEKNQRLSGQVTWVGTSSMEIRMQIHEVLDGNNGDDSNEQDKPAEHWLEGFFTFVAVDPKTQRPTKICPLQPETSEERALFELGALKAAKKKQSRKRGIYSLGKQMTEEDINMEKRAEQLLEEAFPLLHMPSLADSQAILMSHTELQNTLIAQPQVRNLANRIFGGFLMRRAFELAFSNAYCFGGRVLNVFYISISCCDGLTLPTNHLFNFRGMATDARSRQHYFPQASRRWRPIAIHFKSYLFPSQRRRLRIRGYSTLEETPCYD